MPIVQWQLERGLRVDTRFQAADFRGSTKLIRSWQEIWIVQLIQNKKDKCLINSGIWYHEHMASYYKV